MVYKYGTKNTLLKDAKKGIRFSQLPRVLYLNLKRYQHTMDGRLEKVDSRFEFYQEINLDKYMSQDSEEQDNTYVLYSVFVHAGSISSGHYYIYINVKNEKRFKMNDSIVSQTDFSEIETSYGGKSGSGNAYMLVYIRKSELRKIFTQNRSLSSNLIEQFQNFSIESMLPLY